jgi:hypothetical protein
LSHYVKTHHALAAISGCAPFSDDSLVSNASSTAADTHYPAHSMEEQHHGLTYNERMQWWRTAWCEQEILALPAKGHFYKEIADIVEHGTGAFACRLRRDARSVPHRSRCQIP